VIGTKIAACNAIMADYADVSKRGLAGNNFLSENPVTQSLENLIIICRGEYSYRWYSIVHTSHIFIRNITYK
jgi:hypothetical protein